MTYRILLPVALLALSSTSLAQCERRTITPVQADVGDWFGDALAVDGDRLVVGAPNAGDFGPDRSGEVYVFERVGGSWSQAQRIQTPPLLTQAFGASVALEGDVLVVGAPRTDTRYDDGGALFVYEYDSGQGMFLPTQTILDPVTYYAALGSDVDIDGDLLVAGAPADTEFCTGSALVYRYDPVDAEWKFEASLEPTTTSRRINYAIDVELDGDRIAVANKNAWEAGSGEVVVFRHVGGTWVEEAVVSPTAGDPLDNTGTSISLDGDTLVVDAQFSTAGNGSGTVSVFEWDGSSSTWMETQILTPADGQPEDIFGTTLSLNGDSLLVQDRGVHVGGEWIGAVYRFERDPITGRFVELGRVLPDQTGLTFEHWALDMGAAEIVVGARLYTDQFLRQGVVYTYSRDGCDSIGTAYCGPMTPNSTGFSATITATGFELAGGEPLRLIASDLPPAQFGYFLVASDAGFVANPGGSQGNLCLAGNIGRYAKQVQSSGAAGRLTLEIDTLNLPTSPPVAIQAGETWRFQAWFRDKNPMLTSNFTNGVEVMFQ